MTAKIFRSAQIQAQGASDGENSNLARHSSDFERAVANELGVLYRVARRLGTTQEEAEDLVQATLIKAFKNWHQFDGRYLRSWLVRILRNERLAGLRSRKSEPEWEELTEEVGVEAPFWRSVESHIEADQILAALEYLPEPYRLAVQLCDVEQMSYEEAAMAMEVPIGTVRSRLFRARVELRRKLGGGQ